MLKNITHIFSVKKKAIQDEITLKSKTEEVLTGFMKKEVLKKVDMDYRLSFTINKGVIKIETDNKLIAQEIALRIRSIEERLRGEGVNFRKLLI